MQYYFKYWYGTATYASPVRLYTLGTIIKSTNLNNARRGLEDKIKCYLEKKSRLGRKRKIHEPNKKR